jgi:hypothetical protein
LGTVLGSTYMGSMVSPSEKGIAKIIESLPSNSIVLSTQSNTNLVEIYGKKDFLGITFLQNCKDKQQLEILANDYINSYIVKESNRLIKNYNFVIYHQDIYTENGVTLKNKTTAENISSSEVLENLRKYDPTNYKRLINSLNKLDNIKNRPKYFVYSFAKLRGLFSTREWWRQANDEKDYNFFRSLKGKDVIYKDNNAILLKLN